MLRKNFFFVVSIIAAGLAGYYLAWYPEIIEFAGATPASILGLAVLATGAAVLVHSFNNPSKWGTVVSFALGVGGAYFALPILGSVSWLSLFWLAGALGLLTLLWSLTVLDSKPGFSITKTTSAKE